MSDGGKPIGVFGAAFIGAVVWCGIAFAWFVATEIPKSAAKAAAMHEADKHREASSLQPPEEPPAPEISKETVECGTGKYLDDDRTPALGEAHQTYPAAGCWTDWQLVSSKDRDFFRNSSYALDGDLECEYMFSDGTTMALLWTPAAMKNLGPPLTGRHRLTAIRARNVSGRAVHVVIRTWGKGEQSRPADFSRWPEEERLADDARMEAAQAAETSTAAITTDTSSSEAPLPSGP